MSTATLSILGAVKILLKTALPAIGLAVMDQVMAMITAVFSGMIGSRELDAMSLSTAATKLILQCTGLALSGTTLTFISQSNNSRNPKQVGVYLQSAVYLTTFIIIVSATILYHLYYILVALGQDELVAIYANQFIMMYVFGNGGRLMYILLSRYLFCQNKWWPSVIIVIVCNALNALLQYVFIFHAALGIRGPALGYSISYFINVTLHVLYIYFSGIYQRTWSGFTRNSLLEWGTITKMTFSALLMTGLEVYMFETGIILSGTLGVTQLAASSIMMQMWPMIGSVGAGVRDMVAIRLGLCLGEMSPESAKIISRVAFVIAVISGLLNAVLLTALKDVLPRMFSTDKEVLDIAVKLMLVLAVMSVAITIKRVTDGIFFGCGKQAYGGIVSVLAYGVVTAPVVGCLLFLTDVGVFGFWWGMTLGLAVGALCQMIIIHRLDWRLEADKAQIRAKVRMAEKTLDKEPTEETGLLSSRNRGAAGQVDLSPSQWRRLFVKRGVMTACIIVLFVASVTLRFVVFVPPSMDSIRNDLMNYTSL